MFLKKRTKKVYKLTDLWAYKMYKMDIINKRPIGHPSLEHCCPLLSHCCPLLSMEEIISSIYNRSNCLVVTRFDPRVYHSFGALPYGLGAH